MKKKNLFLYAFFFVDRTIKHELFKDFSATWSQTRVYF